MGERCGERTVKISVIMIDGGFRENIHGAEYFSKQDFPEDQYEIFWIDYFDKPHEGLKKFHKVKVITLNGKGTYHSSYCFNRGLIEASGEIVVIPDADQIVPPDFLSRVWKIHSTYDKLVVYGYRYDETARGLLESLEFDELKRKCVLKNPMNYGGCLTVRKKWLMEINGYEQHPLFKGGNHSNGLDMSVRFKNIGLAIQWEPSLILYHPWHDFAMVRTAENNAQEKLVEWRRRHMQWGAFQGIDPSGNSPIPDDAREILESELESLEASGNEQREHHERSMFNAYYYAAGELEKKGGKDWKYFYGAALDILLGKEKKARTDMYNIASIYKKLTQYENARKWFREMIENTKDKKLTGGGYFHMGEMDYMEEDFSSAKRCFRSCLEFLPGHSKAREYLEKLDTQQV
jgi:TolA-binding protein